MKLEDKKKGMAGKMKGTIHERTVNGGWEKVRGDVTREDFEKGYSRKHKIGAVKGQPMYKFREQKGKESLNIPKGEKNEGNKMQEGRNENNRA